MIKNHQKTAIVYQEQKINYSQLLQNINCYAQAYKKNPTFQKVLIFSENSIDWIYALYGTLKIGAIAVPIDAQSTINELKYVLHDCQPDIIFVSPSKRELVDAALTGFEKSVTVLMTQDVDLSQAGNMPVEEFVPTERNKTALIIYTSGTTGSSKGVMLSYENIYFNMDAVSKEIPIFTGARNTMILLPLHHVFPLVGSMMAPFYTGGTVYMAENLSPESIIKTLNEGQINLFIGVPRLYNALAKGVMDKIKAKTITKFIYNLAAFIQFRPLSNFLFSSVHKKFGGHLEYLVSGGAALSVETANIFKTLGFYVLDGYGMTETSPMISFTQPGKWKIGYAGIPLAGTEVKSEDGEICVKGAHVMQGYYNRPEETAQIIQNGWLHTGDIGFVNRFGIKLTGRLKEIIVTSNGKNINPEELELEFVKNSSYVKEVGIFMEDNILQALIIPEMNAIRTKSVQDLPELIKKAVVDFNNLVSPYKRIKRFHIISEELPKTRLGKIQRFKLKEFISEKNIQQNDDNKEYSEQYLLLKSFVEKETGNFAGEHDHFEIDLAMDSLSRVALMAYIEFNFGVILNEENMNELNTLGKLNEYIEKTKTMVSQHKAIEWKEILASKISDFKLPKAGFINRVTNIIFKIVFILTYRYRYRGIHNVPNEPCIIVANHQSFIDGLLISSTLRAKISSKTYFFAKEKHWRNFIMNFFARNNNVILMDINKNLREALQKLSYVLRNGKNVIIFPEGTRSKNGIQDFKETFAILSKELNVPIVPVVIYGSDRASFRKIKFPRYFAPLSVDFLETVRPRRDETTLELKERVKAIIGEKITAYLDKRRK
jgi:long-chain acyl-CoA synthetase